MRSLFTALAFLVILLAVIPAVKRSLYPSRKRAAAGCESGDRTPARTDQT